MLKISVLASGNGSNLQSIIDKIENGELNGKIIAVISDKRKSYALERARKHNIKDIYVKVKDFETREAFDVHIAGILKEQGTDLVVLAGFMRILSEKFVNEFYGKLINIHPALLPKYPGIHSIERAYKDKEKSTGVTVHYVDSGVDTGPIIKQIEVPIKENDTLDELEERVHKVEHEIYAEVIGLFCDGKIKLEGRNVQITES